VPLRERLIKLIPAHWEVILRSGGRVRYLNLGRITQSFAILLAICAFGWSSYATGRFLSHESILTDRNTEIATLRSENEALAANLSDARKTAEIQELSLTATQRTTVDLVASNQDLQFQIAGLESKLRESNAQHQAMTLSYLGSVEAHALTGTTKEALEAREDALEADLAQREQHLADIMAERSRLDAQVAAAQRDMQRLKQEIGTLDYARLDLIDRLDDSNKRLQSVVAEKKRVDGEREDLGVQVVELSDRLETIETAQIDIVSRLGEQAGESGDALKRTLEIAGLDVDHLLGRLARSDAENGSGVGGPLVALADAPGSNLTYQIATVGQRIDDFQRLQDLMERLPLAAPLDEYRLTSGYGRRIDPFTKAYALHSGIDLASRRRAPVHVTSPGVVTFVGWKGGFGKIVEVDHGLGIRTRYAHLSNIYVKRGQTLEYREKVGQIGSTGRSSGEHLHYEVIVDGRSQDPASFIKAGQYVFKN
jgi:murein DD-endopeptidase MepM/ murein hydrolase activator NlpD